jgi:ATP-dependent Lhr-like helicase
MLAERLHPVIQHHLVNSLGWPGLRPSQEAALEPLLAGESIVLVAPTAGGKTEAATFPLLSRMMEERWTGLSVLYICPIRALLNNLLPRMEKYMAFGGRQAGLWHGDVGQRERKRILADPPDLLLTTPESLEAMLISTRLDHAALFRNLRAVVIDELHAFAGDDRGWHLSAVMERLGRLAGRDLQRVGLSATVGAPEGLAAWVAGADRPPARVVIPDAPPPPTPDLTIDYVGTVENAATVISRLHAGEKRLVFCDSRAGVESIAHELRERRVETFVSHGSLGQDERRRAEEAFSEGANCVIVATSTLELGLDVGDLDRVIQIDAPYKVAGFLQRLGRTGRRPGTIRNCLFLTTDPDTLLRAAGLLRLWAKGYVEPVTPPPAPYHLLAQQSMALVLQEPGLLARDIPGWIAGVPAFAEAPPTLHGELMQHMLAEDILAEDTGRLGFGKEGEARFGQRHFMDLVAAFTTPPLFLIRHGRAELGWVHHASFISRDGSPPVILLAGKPWVVTEIDWPARTAWVQPTEDEGSSRWMGSSLALSAELCRSIREVLLAPGTEPWWSKRAAEQLAAIQQEFQWLRPDHTALVYDGRGRCTWWTFAGLHANAMLAEGLTAAGMDVVATDNFAIRLVEPEGKPVANALKALDAATLEVPVPPQALDELKFSEALPREVAEAVMRARLDDRVNAARALGEGLVVVRVGE